MILTVSPIRVKDTPPEKINLSLIPEEYQDFAAIFSKSQALLISTPQALGLYHIFAPRNSLSL